MYPVFVDSPSAFGCAAGEQMIGELWPTPKHLSGGICCRHPEISRILEKIEAAQGSLPELRVDECVAVASGVYPYPNKAVDGGRCFDAERPVGVVKSQAGAEMTCCVDRRQFEEMLRIKPFY